MVKFYPGQMLDADAHGDPYSPSNLAGNWLVEEFRTVAASPVPQLNDRRFKRCRVNQGFSIESAAPKGSSAATLKFRLLAGAMLTGEQCAPLATVKGGP